MTINSKMIEPFNAQIKSEFTASAQYIAIAAYFDELGLKELGEFFFRQSEDPGRSKIEPLFVRTSALFIQVLDNIDHYEW